MYVSRKEYETLVRARFLIFFISKHRKSVFLVQRTVHIPRNKAQNKKKVYFEENLYMQSFKVKDKKKIADEKIF